jgi:ribosomal protein S18 acetylase RimI-like enzyme
MEERDVPAVSKMFIALHEHLNELGSLLKPNIEKLDDYLKMQIGSRLGRVIILKEDEELAGFVCVSIRPINKMFFADGLKSAGFISELYVCPAYRRKSYAKMLISAAEDFLKAADVRLIQLDVLVNNSSAISLYEDCGYLPNYTTLNKKL